MPPVLRQIPRFIAGSSEEGLPYGRWGEQVTEVFTKACEPHIAEAGGPPGELEFFPERSWGGRVWVPVAARAQTADGAGDAEYFGHVSFSRPEGSEPTDLKATADWTDQIAEANPGWKVDLNDEVIGAWNGEGDRKGDVTLLWGVPIVRGALAVTAELDGEVVDQAPVTDDHFTLIANDALNDRGEALYLTIKVWGKRGIELASESLYEADEPGTGDESATA